MKSASVHRKNRVVVVGTTPDYIHWIRQKYPDRALFLTDPRIREAACEPAPPAHEEILVRLENKEVVLSAFFSHLKTFGHTITGLACFDCESLEMAAVIASVFDLDFVTVETVRNCRDKFLSKKIWRENGIPCPRHTPVNSLEEALAFMQDCQNGIVLKPFYGSGSELVFRCRTKTECDNHFKAIQEGLIKRQSNPIFKKLSSTEHLMLAEEFVAGPEYSCDMLIEGDAISIIRTAKKIKPSNRPFGTVSGYILPAALPLGEDGALFKKMLLKSARVLGINRGICMVDFVISNHRAKLIELTPRPGGDCLPALLKAAGNLDIIGMTLDIAEKQAVKLNEAAKFSLHVGLRIHAHKAGILKGFNADELMNEKRIKSIQYIRKPGHCITLPPADYDSWLLGHMIIEPEPQRHLEAQSFLIGNRLKVEIAP